MENLKAIIVFLLFWSIVIWCARIIKRKRDKQMMEFSEELPEMELVTDEEERKYICKNMVEMGKVENLFWGSVFLFNWWTIVRAIVEICREWSNGIAYELHVTGLSSTWTGDASAAYISKFKKLQTDMDTMGRMINEHVTNLTNMAKDYTSTESSNASATDVLSGNVIS